ncbi:Fc receptor-like protein 4 isoform X2 [Xenopus laevis]|uniref:Fc receptor-like protein 4 isoform X2 n=1 Tax=Xenopus laevis TaxID=8355 RepID=A0A8J1LKB5_XENLA|nr:Fc receptor-like protein 4 isoform X2 [Xenopus laevis]
MASTGALVRPVVSFSPNWATISLHDSVTLICNVGSTSLLSQRYSWYKDNERIKGEEQNFRIENTEEKDRGNYKDNEKIKGEEQNFRIENTEEKDRGNYKDNERIKGEEQNFRIENAEEKDRGNYQCQTGTSERSDPVRLNVTNHRVILQAPPSVYEGDQLTLRCYTPNYKAKYTTFYKDNVNISSSSTDTVTLVASVGMTGTYRCKTLLQLYSDHYSPYISAEIVITIQELFSRPEIRANNNSLQEGDLLTITCHTVLNPARANTELQFAFYRNGHNVQGFHSSNHYTIQSARPQDSGNYTCHTAAPSVSVTKGSKELTIYFQAVAVMASTGALVRPVVSFSPNWATISLHDSITLTCNVSSTSLLNQRYSWYKDNERIKGEEQNFRIENAEEKDSGNYQCQTGTSERSDPVRLDVTNERLILQAPPSVYEGDPLTLRCYTPNSIGKEVTFYKDNVIISSSPTDTVTLDTSVGMTGTYRCKALLPSELHCYSHYTSAEIVITIQELFSRPEIRANNNSLQEGDLLTISCHTVLNPARANTELQFAFYRNGHNVQGFHSSNHYTIQSARPQDSGSYTCHTAAPSVSVTKGSKELTIYFQGGSYTIENIIRLVLSVCILLSVPFLCYFHIK